MMREVAEFNRTILRIEPRPIGVMKDEEALHLAKCLHEEASEFHDAFLVGDLIGTVDALIDSIYFALGGFHKMGLPPELVDQIFLAVHDANMTKRKGIVKDRDTGAPDAVKPDGWTPPEERIGLLIDAYMGENQ
jgi:predicted HAD superfamily Cof-like phosphohydrolase